jgi:hypothetical protein
MHLFGNTMKSNLEKGKHFSFLTDWLLTVGFLTDRLFDRHFASIGFLTVLTLNMNMNMNRRENREKLINFCPHDELWQKRSPIVMLSEDKYAEFL